MSYKIIIVRKVFLGLILIPLLAVLTRSHDGLAAEGMFYMDELRDDVLPLKKMQDAGLQIPLADIRRLAKGVVKIGRGGRGGTAFFASPNGLLVTNHHVALDCLAKLTKPEKDILNPGFVARNRGEEKVCPDLLVLGRVLNLT